MQEAWSLALVLGVPLVLSALERRGHLPWSGYPLSLVLLVLCWWHNRRFGATVRFFPSQQGRAQFSVVFALGLIAALFVSVYVVLWPSAVPQSTIPQLLHLLIFVPLSEELYFRGLLFEHLRKSFSAPYAILLCTLLFALLHLPSNGTIVAGILSLAACALVLKSGALVFAFQLHVAWNGFVGMNDHRGPLGRWTWAITASSVIVATTLASLRAPRTFRR